MLNSHECVAYLWVKKKSSALYVLKKVIWPCGFYIFILFIYFFLSIFFFVFTPFFFLFCVEVPTTLDPKSKILELPRFCLSLQYLSSFKVAMISLIGFSFNKNERFRATRLFHKPKCPFEYRSLFLVCKPNI